jgi:hypothetical protein
MAVVINSGQRTGTTPNTTQLGGQRQGSSGLGNTSAPTPEKRAPRISMRETDDIIENIITKSVAEGNYDDLKVNDPKVAKLRKHMLQLAKSWTLYDKINTISQFGDATYLPKNQKDRKESIIDEQFAKTLITRLDPQKLNELMKDVIAEEKQLVKIVDNYQKAKKQSQTSFNAKSFEGIYDSAKDFIKTKDIIRARKAYDKSYSVPKYLERQYGKLRTEVLRTLKELYNKMEILGLADRIGVQVPEDFKEVELRLRIANKIVLFVDLLMGKSKGINMAGVITNIEAYNEVLMYTSYAYLTGKPGLTPQEVSLIQKNAKMAKEMQKENLKAKKSANVLMGYFSMRSSRNAKLVGNATTLKKGDIDTGILADKTLEELIEIAARYNVDIRDGGRIRRIEDIKKELYRKIALYADSERRLQNKIDRDRRKGLMTDPKYLQRLEAIKKMKIGTPTTETKGKDIPYVNFSKSGNLQDKDILRAVPVYVINQWLKDKRRSDIDKVDKRITGNKDLSDKEIRREYGLSSIIEFLTLGAATKTIRKVRSAKKKSSEKKREKLIQSFDTGETDVEKKISSIGTKISSGISSVGDKVTGVDNRISESNGIDSFLSIFLPPTITTSVSKSIETSLPKVLQKFALPTVDFSPTGVMSTNSILKAVPVLVINEHMKNLRKESIKQELGGKHIKPARKMELEKELETLSYTPEGMMTSFIKEFIPIVTFNAEGRVTSEQILRAIPVYIVNEKVSVKKPNEKRDRDLEIDADLKIKGKAEKRALKRIDAEESLTISTIKDIKNRKRPASMSKRDYRRLTKSLIKQAKESSKGFKKNIEEQSLFDENNQRLAKKYVGIKNIDLGEKVRTNLQNKNTLEERQRTQQKSMNTPSESTPVVHFGTDGRLNEKDILRAIPVFIVNEWLKAKQEKAKDLTLREEEISEKDKLAKGSKKDIAKSLGLKKGIFGFGKKERLAIANARQDLESQVFSESEDLRSTVSGLGQGPKNLSELDHLTNISQNTRGTMESLINGVAPALLDIRGIIASGLGVSGTVNNTTNVVGSSNLSRLGTPKELMDAGGKLLKVGSDELVNSLSSLKSKKPSMMVTSGEFGDVKHNDMSKVRAAKGTEEGQWNTLLKKEKQENAALKSPFFSIINDSLVDLTNGKSPFLINIGRKDDLFTLKGKKAIRVFDESAIAIAAAEGKANKGKAESATAILSDDAKSFGIESVKKEPAIPVYVVNKQVQTDVVDGLIDIFATVMAKIPVIGKPIAAGLKLISASADGSTSLTELIEAATGKLATGGRGSLAAQGIAKNTHFISGDSLNRKPNPEQVSIDWKSKSYSVKPIPQFATGGGERTTSGITNRMSMSERNAPMAVGISSNLVTYTRTLKDAKEDDSSKKAIKVYAVNPGITDVVDLGGGSSASLIGLVADMSIRLASIEGLLATGNTQRIEAVRSTMETTVSINKLTSRISSMGSNPFTGGLTSELDSILKGE